MIVTHGEFASQTQVVSVVIISHLQRELTVDLMSFNELFNLLQDSDETDRVEAKSAAQGIGKSFLETVHSSMNPI